MQRRRSRVATSDYDFDSVVIDLGAAEELVGFRLAVRQLQRQRLAAVDNNAQAVSIEVVARRDRAAQPGRAILHGRCLDPGPLPGLEEPGLLLPARWQIGRASCGERGCQEVEIS